LNEFCLPELGLENPESVLDYAISSTRLDNIQKSMSNTSLSIPSIPSDLLEQVKYHFNEICKTRNSDLSASATIPVDVLGDLLYSVGLQISEFELDGIKSQLWEKDISTLSYADVIEILAFIQSEEKVYENEYNQEEKKYFR
jgi:hypothetical protein